MSSFVDLDTPWQETSLARLQDGKALQLVMSDEFTIDNRGFQSQQDKIFEALHMPDETNQVSNGSFIHSLMDFGEFVD